MNSSVDHLAASPVRPPQGYPALRLVRRVLLGALGLFALAYYNLDLLPMVGHTLIPFAALLGVGALLGTLTPGRISVATFTAWWVVVLASVLRRSAVAQLPLGSQIFDGALRYYPAWGAWLAEFLRLGVYLWALWLGAKFGRRRRLRRAPGTP